MAFIIRAMNSFQNVMAAYVESCANRFISMIVKFAVVKIFFWYIALHDVFKNLFGFSFDGWKIKISSINSRSVLRRKSVLILVNQLYSQATLDCNFAFLAHACNIFKQKLDRWIVFFNVIQYIDKLKKQFAFTV